MQDLYTFLILKRLTILYIDIISHIQSKKPSKTETNLRTVQKIFDFLSELTAAALENFNIFS